MIFKFHMLTSILIIMVFQTQDRYISAERNSSFISSKQQFRLTLGNKTLTNSPWLTVYAENRSSGCLESIQRLPPPGGTSLNFKIQQILQWSNYIFDITNDNIFVNHMSFNIVIDADYKTLVGTNVSEFKKSVMTNLHRMRWNNFFIHNLDVREGSIRIFFNISRRTNSSLKKGTFRPKNHPLVKRGISSSVMSVHKSDVGGRNAQHVIMKREAKIIVNFQVDTNYPDVAGGKEEEFKQHLLREVARDVRVPLSTIRDFSIVPGMIVSFALIETNDGNYIMDEQSILEAAEELQTKAQTNQLRLTDLNGRPLISSQANLVTSEKGRSMEFSYATLGVLISVLIMMGVLVVLAAVLVKNHGIKREVKETKQRTKAYQDTAIQETGRDSMLSMSGRYSYDSGLWLGPGPEPSFMVPEESIYRPPTREQLAATPRPGTAVRSRLKKSWNIDSEQSLTPIPDGGENGHWEEENNTAPFTLAPRSISEVEAYERN